MPNASSDFQITKLRYQFLEELLDHMINASFLLKKLISNHKNCNTIRLKQELINIFEEDFLNILEKDEISISNSILCLYNKRDEILNSSDELHIAQEIILEEIDKIYDELVVCSDLMGNNYYPE